MEKKIKLVYIGEANKEILQKNQTEAFLKKVIENTEIALHGLFLSKVFKGGIYSEKNEGLSEYWQVLLKKAKTVDGAFIIIPEAVIETSLQSSYISSVFMPVLTQGLKMLPPRLALAWFGHLLEITHKNLESLKSLSEKEDFLKEKMMVLKAHSLDFFEVAMDSVEDIYWEDKSHSASSGYAQEGEKGKGGRGRKKKAFTEVDSLEEDDTVLPETEFYK
jgi:hypothetical protein